MLEDQDTVLNVLVEYKGRYLLPDFFCPELPREVQRNLIHKICSASSRAVCNQYAISKEWLDQWDTYVGGAQRKPSIINNSVIVDERGVAPGSNYAVINGDSWIFLMSWYGADFAVRVDPTNVY